MTAVLPRYVPSSDGVEVAVHDLGGDGPLVVLCHATGFCAPVWEPFAAHLADRYRLVALDFRAHGRTRTPDTVELVWSGMAEDLLAVVDAVADGGPVRAAGHSMGGASIVLAEARRPGTFLRAWAYEPILFPRAGLPGAQEPPGIAESARRRRADFDSRDEAVERWSGKPPLSLLDRRCLEAYARGGLVDRPDGGVTMACRPEREAEIFEHHNSGAFDVLAEVRFELAVRAGVDGERPSHLVRLAAEAYPWLDAAWFDDLTHFGPLEAPERLADDAAAWLR
jgi:pimeloyl-ACP methyl ester carboxylesterase